MEEAAEPLEAADLELIAAAREEIRRHYRPEWHTVGAAIRDSDGRIWTGVHLGATVGRMDICAEVVALGRAVVEGSGKVLAVAAVRHPKPGEGTEEIAVVSPCGACRELLFDYGPDARVILPGGRKLPVSALLPAPYRR